MFYSLHLTIIIGISSLTGKQDMVHEQEVTKKKVEGTKASKIYISQPT